MAGKIFKFLPKAASFSIPNPNNNNNKNKSKYMFSGPILPMIPDHCRRRKMLEEEEEEEEPTSPKVSCIGQVNHKKKSNSKKKTTTTMKKALLEEQQQQQKKKKKKKEKEAPKRTSSSIGGMFWRKAKPARRDDRSDDDEGVGAAPAAGIGRMRRYASGRVEALKDFDWRTIAQDDDDIGDEKEAGQLVAHSGPILVGGGKVALEPKKEANIWMRRTRTPPVPLQLN